MQSRVTFSDIAEKLNISKSLVSRALGDKYGVSDETRSHIRITAVEMGYDFRNIRRNNKKNSVRTSTVVLTRAALSDELFYLRLIYSIERELNERHIEFNLCVIESEDEKELLIGLNRICSDGVIVIGMVSLENTAAILSGGMPTVMIDFQHDHLKVNRITINNYAGTYEAAKYLYSLGHRAIGFAGWVDYSNNFRNRYRGFCDLMCANGLAGTKYSCTGAPSADSCVLMNTERFSGLLSGDDRPTAVICGNDRIAFSVYEIAGQSGLQIPGDLSVIGFDNVDKCGWVTPKLTSIDFNQNQIAHYAVEMLIDSMKSSAAATRSVVLDANITIRESVHSVDADTETEVINPESIMRTP